MTDSILIKLGPLGQFLKEKAAIGFSLLSGYGYLHTYFRRIDRSITIAIP
jgi:hypothetical protein